MVTNEPPLTLRDDDVCFPVLEILVQIVGSFLRYGT